MKIVDDLLTGDSVVQKQTPNVSGEFTSGLPDTLVMHFTAGSSAESSVRHLSKPSAKASAHLVIGRDGAVYQLAPFNIMTWHAGASSWGTRNGLNKYSIGIELDNAGELNDNSNGTYLSWFNKAYPENEVFFGTHRHADEPSYWHAYTEQQLEVTFDICHLLVDHYKIKEILGHEEISPGRKTDPGPAFPLDTLREEVLTDNRKSDGRAENRLDFENHALVNASKLNIRRGPGTGYDLAGDPLRRGDMVKSLREQFGWTEVEYKLRGWVSKKYLDSLDS